MLSVDESKQKVFSKVNKLENGCWQFTGAKDKDGYGLVYLNGKQYKAHRIAVDCYDSTKIVMHWCDYPSCVNPCHLKIATHYDNVHDMINKGRNNFFLSNNRITKPMVSHCKYGHEYSKENTRIYKTERHCRQCERLRSKRRYETSKCG